MTGLARAFSARRASLRFRRTVLLIVAIVAAGGLPALGYLAHSHVHYVLAAGGLLLLAGVLIVDVRFIPLLTVPCTLIVLRVGGSSGLSISDLVLFLGTLCSLSVFRLRESPEMRQLLWILCIYQASTILTVIDNPYRSDIIEWVHEAFLVGGSLIVGWVVARAGKARPAVTVYVLGSCFIALWACLQTLTHHLQAAYLPGGMQKNYIGDMLAFAVVLAYSRPYWVGWRRALWPRLAMIICLAGILSSQSKQAIISLAIGIGFIYFRNRGLGNRSKVIFVAIVPLVIIAYSVISSEISSHNRFNSFYTRLSSYSQSLTIWEHSPLVGVGLRWWYTSRFVGSIQPPNAEMEMLTSAGILGLLGLITLFVGSVSVLRAIPRRLGTLALAILLMRFVQGQLDIFWVAAQGSLPWMIAGLVLGVAALERSQARPPPGLPSMPSGLALPAPISPVPTVR